MKTNHKEQIIVDGSLHIITVKTSDSLIIELNKYSRTILDKYANAAFKEDKALPVISNQKTTKKSKEVRSNVTN